MAISFTLAAANISDSEPPTPEKIAEILTGLLALPDHNDNYLIVDRIDDEVHRAISVSYMQTFLEEDEPGYEGLCLVQCRDGIAGRHYESFVETGAPVIEVFVSYLNNDDLWRELVVWRDISYEFEDLRAAMPYAELAASYFPEGEWEKAMEAIEEKRQRDEAFWDQVEE